METFYWVLIPVSCPDVLSCNQILSVANLSCYIREDIYRREFCRDVFNACDEVSYL